MRLHLAPLKRFLPTEQMPGREALIYQRLVWGALCGCLAAVLLGESPFLESLELSMLKWRYKVSHKLNVMRQPAPVSDDVSVIAFDDSSQFDLGIARFNDMRSQAVLAEALNVIERGDPA